MRSIIIVLLACFLLAGCSTTPVQDTQYTIAIFNWVSGDTFNKNLEGFKASIAEEDINIQFIDATANADKESQTRLAEALLESTDLFYSLSTTGTATLQEVVTSKPIVYSMVSYPLQSGIVDSMEGSGTNIVGTQSAIAIEDRFRPIEEIFPEAKRIGFVKRKGEVNSDILFAEAEAYTNLELVKLEAETLDDIVEFSRRDDIDVFYAACDTLVGSGGGDILVANALKTPVVACSPPLVSKGAVFSTETDYYNYGYQSGKLAVQVLRGADPGSMKSIIPRSGKLIVNKDRLEDFGSRISGDHIVVSTK